MSPKISVHGGPTHKGDPPKPSRKSFGAALAAARRGAEVVAADGPELPGVQVEPVRYRDGSVMACPTCHEPVTQFSMPAEVIEGEPTATNHRTWTPGDRMSIFQPCGHVLGPTSTDAFFTSDFFARLAEPGSEPTTATVDSPPTDEQLADRIREWVRVDGDGPVTDMDTVPVSDGCMAEPSSSGDLITAEGGTGPDDTDPDATASDVPEPEGGEQPSPGTSSSTSPKKRRTSSDGPKPRNRSRARSTGNPSPQDPEADSTAGSAVEQTTTSGSDK